MNPHVPRHASLRVGAIALLGAGHLHCSPEPAPSTAPESSAGAMAVGGAGAGSDSGSPGGNSFSGTGGAVAGVGGSGSQGGGDSTSGAPTSGSAGAAGAGGVSGSGGGSATSCAGDAILCEDFEGHVAGSEPAGGWAATRRGDGKVVVDTTRAFSGKQSLHVSGKMNADRANISRSIQSDSLAAYVRFMMYATSYPASSGVHTRLMRIGNARAASGNPDSSYSLAAYNGVAVEKVNSIYLRDTGTHFDDSRLLNRWTCWEFAIDKSGGVGKVEVQIWVDGEELPLSPAGSSSHGMTSPSWDPIPFEVFMLGLDGFQADPQPADFWIDDLSVTPQRVGCPEAP
jgi:hypothetical protein